MYTHSMNGLFLTCLLMSTSAVCGQRSLAVQIESLSQRFIAVRIEAGKVFVADTIGDRLCACSAGTHPAPLRVQPLVRSILRIAFVASTPVLRSLQHASPIRGPAA